MIPRPASYAQSVTDHPADNVELTKNLKARGRLALPLGVLQLDREILPGVIKTNIFHHRPQQFDICGCFTISHPTADHLAQDSAKIFMASIRKEAAAIGQHTHEAA